jgi:xylulokinase
VVDPRGEISAFCDSTDHWLPLACTMNVANVVDRIRALFGWDMRALENGVAGTKAGAAGITFLPYLQGERLPNLPNGSGVLHGLNLQNTNRADIGRAVIEGIIFGLANGWKRMSELGISATELRLTGGGSKSAVARQIICDVFGMPVTGFRVWEGAALGAAIHAAWTYCKAKGNPVPLEKLVKSTVKVDRKTCAEPRKENVALYAELRGRHADLTRKLATGGYL